MPHINGLLDETDHHLANTILRAIREIRYGSVEIIIHDSRIVQIERKEKIRLDTDPAHTTQRAR
ncbi:MAG TPA: YezD family protein [Nitrospiraceae bacterium]|nr:YezD family protein [Nitrospiraceae bacterium]